MLFTQALILGLIVVIPIGPIAILIMQRSIQVGWLAGLSSGLGAALADGLFAFLTALGLSTLLTNLDNSRHLIRPIGALFLMLIGCKFIFQSPPKLQTEEVLSPRYLHHYLWDGITTFLLTLTNPLTIMAFAALFTGSNLIPDETKKIEYLQIVSGVFLGSLIWWCILVLLAQRLKNIFSPQLLHKIFVVIGALLIGLAIFSVSTRLGTLVDKFK